MKLARVTTRREYESHKKFMTLRPHCGKDFQPGLLKARVVAEDKAFDMKARVLFLVAFLVLPAMLFFIPLTL